MSSFASEAGVVPFETDAWRGERSTIVGDISVAELGRIAVEGTGGAAIHRGRNVLYEIELPTTDGAARAVVKRFRHESVRSRLDRRYRRSKAERSWDVGRSMIERDVPTPEPLLWIESREVGGPAMYVCRALDAVEARGHIHALNGGTLERGFPDWTSATLVDTIARCAKRLHDAGIWHRDFSAGNLLLTPGPSSGAPSDGFLVDLNRSRVRPRVGRLERLRDLCRMPLERRVDRARLLTSYDGRAPSVLTWWTYSILFSAFHGRHRLKQSLRRRFSVSKNRR